MTISDCNVLTFVVWINLPKVEVAAVSDLVYPAGFSAVFPVADEDGSVLSSSEKPGWLLGGVCSN